MNEQFTITLQLDLTERQMEGSVLVGKNKLIRANLYWSSKDKLWNLVFNLNTIDSSTAYDLILEHYKAQNLIELTNKTYTLYLEDEGVLKANLNSSDFKFDEIPSSWFDNNDL